MSWSHRFCFIYVSFMPPRLKWSSLYLFKTQKSRFCVFKKYNVLFWKNHIQFDPYLESSFFWKSQVGRNTILTPSHMLGSENQNFLYYHGVANNLGKTDVPCYWLDGEIWKIWNCIKGVFWKFIQYGGPQKLGKINIISFISLILYYIYIYIYIWGPNLIKIS